MLSPAALRSAGMLSILPLCLRAVFLSRRLVSENSAHTCQLSGDTAVRRVLDCQVHSLIAWLWHQSRPGVVRNAVPSIPGSVVSAPQQARIHTAEKGLFRDQVRRFSRLHQGFEYPQTPSTATSNNSNTNITFRLSSCATPIPHFS